MKNSFVMYTEWGERIGQLSLRQKGLLFEAVMQYAAGLPLPQMEGVVKMAFGFMKAQMDRDREKYEKKVEACREAGKKGGRPKKAEKANACLDNHDNKKCYGVYENVYLQDDEYAALCADYPNAAQAIDFYSTYIKRKGGGDLDHCLALRGWVFDALRERELKQLELQSREQRAKIKNIGKNPDPKRAEEYEKSMQDSWAIIERELEQDGD